VKCLPGPPSNFPTPPRAPHRCRELPRPPCRRPRLLLCCTAVAPHRSVCSTMEPPAPVSPPLSMAAKPVRHPAGLLSSHSTAAHRPLADQILPASHRCRRRRKPPLFHLGPKGSMGWVGKVVAKWAWPIPTVPFFFSELIQNSIEI
jgi:hypothetical protein